jgi:cytochrome P450 family 20 subfamily A
VADAGSLHQYLMKLHSKHGPLASFWWQEKLVVSLASPELFKETSRLFDRPGERSRSSLYSCQNFANFSGTVDLFKLFEPLIGEQSIQYANQDEGKWRRQNYDVSYSHDAINEMLETFNKVMTCLER